MATQAYEIIIRRYAGFFKIIMDKKSHLGLVQNIFYWICPGWDFFYHAIYHKYSESLIVTKDVYMQYQTSIVQHFVNTMRVCFTEQTQTTDVLSLNLAAD